MSAAARRGRGGNVVEYAPAASEYQLTELKNVSTGRANNMQNVEFNIRLVQAVREHPSLFDSGDPHFGERNQGARHRQQIWQQVASAIGYNDHLHLLPTHWRKLKERYTRERSKGVAAGAEPLDDGLAAEMGWLDEYVLGGIPPSSSSAAAAAPPEPPEQQMYYMEGEDDLLGEDFVVDQHDDDDYQVEENRLEEEDDEQRRGTSPDGSGTGSDIDVGGVGPSQAPLSHHVLSPKDHGGPASGRGGDTGMSNIGGHGSMGGAGTSRSMQHTGRQQQSGTTNIAPHTSHNYRYATSSHQQQHHPPEVPITVSARSNGTLIAHPKREGSVSGAGSTLTMVIDPTTYYQNGTQKMYRLVNVADLDQSTGHHLQHLRTGGAGMGGGTLIAESAGGMGYSIGRGTRKRMGAPLSPPSHASGMLGGPSSSADLTSPYGKSSGQLGDELILDDGIVGENTIVIDHQRDDDSPLLVDSPGMHHHHHHGHHGLMMGGPSSSHRGMHRGQLSPTLLGNGSSVRGSGAYSPGFSSQSAPNNFATSQYDADLALQHFISSHLSKMNEDDKAIAKMNIQRILLDARYGAGTTMRVCMGEEEAELTDAAVASEMVTEE